MCDKSAKERDPAGVMGVKEMRAGPALQHQEVLSKRTEEKLSTGPGGLQQPPVCTRSFLRGQERLPSMPDLASQRGCGQEGPLHGRPEQACWHIGKPPHTTA